MPRLCLAPGEDIALLSPVLDGVGDNHELPEEEDFGQWDFSKMGRRWSR